MTQNEFAKLMLSASEKQGYCKIEVHIKLFAKRVDVTARGIAGKNRKFIVEFAKRHGKVVLRIKPKDNLERSDRVEKFDTFMND